MTHRTDRIYLAPAEPRCSPSGVCSIKDRCARWLAALPPAGASMIGADLPPPWAMCHKYVPATRARAQPAAPAPVKPPVKGIA